MALYVPDQYESNERNFDFIVVYNYWLNDKIMTRFSTKVKNILQSENQQLLRDLIIINYIILFVHNFVI